MKWFNKGCTRGLNTDLVSYWEYWPQTYLNEPTKLDVWISSNPVRFIGDEADEIYQLLIKNKELLKG